MTFDPLVSDQSHVKVSPHMASQSPAPPMAVSAYQWEGAGPLPVVRAAGWQLACDWPRQSLSEPTADDPFLFLFGALGFESSSS